MLSHLRRVWPMLLVGLGLAGSNTLAYYVLRQTSALPRWLTAVGSA
ncbi:hypothetical protein [Gluconobacter sp. P5E10]|nr:hypothetical protein [Gluconobacter sp. P5E10]